jgi:hypothetical protein
MAWYYTFNPTVIPDGNKHTKPGITNSNPIGRLGKYQLPYGPFWEASYSWLAYHPDPDIISWLEDSVLGHFRYRCNGQAAGMTEWLMNTSWQEVREHILSVCKDTGIELVDFGPGPWTPTRIQELDILTKDTYTR